MKKEILFVLVLLLFLVSCTQSSYYSGKAFEQSQDSALSNQGIEAFQQNTEDETLETDFPELNINYFGMMDDPFSVQTNASLSELSQNKKFTENQNLELNLNNIYGLLITGNVKFTSLDDSLVRVILVDSEDNEYLVFESYNRMESENSFSFADFCQETCVLDNKNIKLLKFQIENAELFLNDIKYLDDEEQIPEEAKIFGIKEYNEFLNKEQARVIVNKLNKNLKEQDFLWNARVTGISLFSHAELKKLFPGDPELEIKPEFLFNLKGFEHYGSGIFSFEHPFEYSSYVEEEEEEGEIIEEVLYQANSENQVTGNIVVGNRNPELLLFYSGIDSDKAYIDYNKNFMGYESKIEFEPYYDLEITAIKPEVINCVGDCSFNVIIFEQGKKIGELKEQRNDKFFRGRLNENINFVKGKKYEIQLNLHSTKKIGIDLAGGETPKKMVSGGYNLIYARDMDNKDYFKRGPIAFSLIGDVFAKCFDSDGGKRYYTRGYVKGRNNIYDHCSTYGSDTEYLAEMSCDANDNPLITKKNCRYGCKDGACRTSEQVKKELPKSFDWRNVHGENWITPVKNQAKCGSCWAFGAIGTVESAINLFYNQHLNIDLSEADLVCESVPETIRYVHGGCGGGFSGSWALRKIKDVYVVTEECLPYNSDLIKGYDVIGCKPKKCSNWRDHKWKIKNWETIYNSDTNLKFKLVEKGPMTISLRNGGAKGINNHAMGLMGYEETQIGLHKIPVWIIKNSWDYDWGEKGFVRMILPRSRRRCIYYLEEPYQPNKNIEIKCKDNDKDGYCNWGVSKNIPSSCQDMNCKLEKDCDDSNPNVGSCNNDYESHYELCKPEYKLGKLKKGDTERYVVAGKTYEITVLDASVEKIAKGNGFYEFKKINLQVNGKIYSKPEHQEDQWVINLENGGMIIVTDMQPKYTKNKSEKTFYYELKFAIIACEKEPILTTNQFYNVQTDSYWGAVTSGIQYSTDFLGKVFEIKYTVLDIKNTIEFNINGEKINMDVTLKQGNNNIGKIIRLQDGTLFMVNCITYLNSNYSYAQIQVIG